MAFIQEPALKATIKQVDENTVSLSAVDFDTQELIRWSFSMPPGGGEITGIQNGVEYFPFLDWSGSAITASDIDELLRATATEWKKACKHEGIVAEWTVQKLGAAQGPVRFAGRTRIQRSPSEEHETTPGVVLLIILFFVVPFILGLLGTNM